MVRPEQVLHVARLAKLRLSESEARRLGDQIGPVLEYVELLSELDGPDAPGDPDSESIGEPRAALIAAMPPAHRPRPLRPDEPRPCLARDDVLRAAPSTDGETFRVPPVIEGGGEA